MKVLIAMDSFKGSLSSVEAGEAVSEGIKLANDNYTTIIKPVADGGEGTVETLVNGLNGRFEKVDVSGPLGKKVGAVYGIVGTTAIIEMAAAAGITLVSENERDPLCTSTYGVGEIIKDAIHKKCRNFIIGIGGSATNDGGVGCLQALGFSFRDPDGKEIERGARGLEKLSSIDVSGALKELSECKFQIACDVKNPLCGENGCSAVFAPQKGADHRSIKNMDMWLEKYARLTKKVFPESNMDFPGSGAAGGMGFAFRSYLNADLRSGIEIVIDETNIEKEIKSADIIVTGEGKMDSQSIMGKVPVGIAKIAKKYNKPVIAFCGCTEHSAKICNDYGIDAIFPILRRVETLEECMKTKVAKQNLTDTSEQVFRLINLKI